MTFIVRSNAEELRTHILDDWTGLRDTELVESLHETTRREVLAILSEIFSKRTAERTEEIVRSHRAALEDLDPLGKVEVAEFTRDITAAQPLVSTEILSAAVDALIRLENSQSGQALIQKLARLNPEDVDGLNRLLDEWTVKDALTVLNEVGRRMRVVEAIEKLCGDSAVDELHTLHPLVTHARWLFGVEFDSPHFISNVTLTTALKRITRKRLVETEFPNPRKRPDLLVLDDGTLGATAIDEVADSGLARLKSILLIELKKGGLTIGRDEMEQAFGYAEDLMTSRDIDGTPMVYGFVVGNDVNHDRATDRPLTRNGQDRGVIKACSYRQLVRTANVRLAGLRARIDPRLPDNVDGDLIRAIMAQGQLL